MLATLVLVLGLVFPAHADQLPQQLLATDSVKRPGQRGFVADSTNGKFLNINRIFIIGNRITRDPIILRELTLKSGDMVFEGDLPGILELDRRKLVNTRLFNTVNIRVLDLGTGQVDLLVDLTERWYTFPAPIFELADRNLNEWWQNYNHDFRRVNYGLRLYQSNMRGRNETLKLVAQLGFVRRFELSYRIPYIDKKQKQGLVIDMDYSATRNLGYRTFDHKIVFFRGDEVLRTTRGASLTYTYRKSFYAFHGVKLEYRYNTIADSVLRLNSNYLKEEETHQQYYALTYQFTADRRDYIGYPLHGYYLYGYVRRNGLTPQDDVNKNEVMVNFARFLDLKHDFYLSNNTVGYSSTRQGLGYYNYSALGYGKQFVRGYEVYVIEGPNYVLNKTTLKRKIFSRTYHWNAMPIEQFRHVPLSIFLKTYADVGYVENYPHYDLNRRLSNTLISGFGAGIDIVGSYDAVLRFEYSITNSGQRGFFFHLKREF